MCKNNDMASRAKLFVVLGALAVAGGGFGLYWFQPWKLFVDAEVHEAAPAVHGAARVLSAGAFRSLEHETTGRASLIELADGSRLLRLEDLETSNGPELVVMLSATPATEDGWSAYDDGPHLVLEPLRGNRGSQNYTIPAGTDLAPYTSAVVWCNRFSVGFGAAPLDPP
jgi:hypothetical protein